MSFRRAFVVSHTHWDREWYHTFHRFRLDMSAVVRGVLDRLDDDPSFEHFLLARYHMFLMVYFHPKSDIYDAMLRAWLKSVGDEARFPASTEAYVDCDDWDCQYNPLVSVCSGKKICE